MPIDNRDWYRGTQKPFYEKGQRLRSMRERPGKHYPPDSDLARLARGEAALARRKKWWQFWK